MPSEIFMGGGEKIMGVLQTVAIGCLTASLALGGCQTPSSGQAGQEWVGGCADSQLNSRAVLYFGPSNQIGPGSVWSRLGPEGGYQPQWRMRDLGVDADLINRGSPFECRLSQSSRFAANAALAVISAAANASTAAAVDFSRAKQLEVSATAAAWDTLIAGPYLAGLRAIEDPAIRGDVLGTNRLVLRRALRLDGYRVVMDFDAEVKPRIKTKYAGKTLGRALLGDGGAQLSATWTSDDRLELTATGVVYVAGEFAYLMKGDLVSTKGSPVIEDLGDQTIKPFEPK